MDFSQLISVNDVFGGLVFDVFHGVTRSRSWQRSGVLSQRMIADKMLEGLGLLYVRGVRVGVSEVRAKGSLRAHELS